MISGIRLRYAAYRGETRARKKRQSYLTSTALDVVPMHKARHCNGITMIQKLLKMLEDGRDSPLLRFSLAKALMAARQFGDAAQHLREAVRQDPDYSAAWAALGECRTQLGDDEGAVVAWTEGSAVAMKRGDIQAKRQMEVRLRRARSRGLKGGS